MFGAGGAGPAARARARAPRSIPLSRPCLAILLRDARASALARFARPERARSQGEHALSLEFFRVATRDVPALPVHVLVGPGAEDTARAFAGTPWRNMSSLAEVEAFVRNNGVPDFEPAAAGDATAATGARLAAACVAPRGGEGCAFEYAPDATPTLARVAGPPRGRAGESITLEGALLGVVPGMVRVGIGGAPCVVSAVNRTAATCALDPAAATSGTFPVLLEVRNRRGAWGE